MSTTLDAISLQTQAWNDALQGAVDVADLERVRVQFLGKKGSITALMSIIKDLSPEEKRVVGPALNQLKIHCEASLTARQAELTTLQEQTRIHAEAQSFDVTATVPGMLQGTLHPMTLITQEVQDIFLSMGFELFDGPEVETDYHNFGALNIPETHPARDMYDTLWLTEPGMLMRTHTSTIQARIMRKKVAEGALPFAGISIGRVFRHEAVDASHDHTFMQCEGILIDRTVTLPHLFGVLKTFIGTLFGTSTPQIRTRPGYFPFVEPGVEIDVQCPFCTEGCATCKRTRWIEIFPGGLIHPNVLKEAGIDPAEYSGFAFGFGLTRLAMLRYGIADIRALHNGKVGFLEQFTV